LSFEREKTAIPRAEAAYRQIKRMLVVDQLVAGQKIRYQDLSKKLQMSQTPVIQALTRLENEVLVKSEANKGFFVPELNLNEARELYELRVIIEEFLVQQTAQRITDSQLIQLSEIMAEHASVIGEIYTRQRLWLDARVHLTMASFSGHEVGHKTLANIFDRLYLRYRPERLSATRMNETKTEHQYLLRALRSRDPIEAAKVLRDHVCRGQKRMLAGLWEDDKFRKSFMPWEPDWETPNK
jgi:DNA-binding GntR family transcriptional regulator